MSLDGRKLLALSGSERVLMGCRMFDSARAVILASLPSGISELETKRQLCLRIYGNEVNVAAFIASLPARLKRTGGVPYGTSTTDKK